MLRPNPLYFPHLSSISFFLEIPPRLLVARISLILWRPPAFQGASFLLPVFSFSNLHRQPILKVAGFLFSQRHRRRLGRIPWVFSGAKDSGNVLFLDVFHARKILERISSYSQTLGRDFLSCLLPCPYNARMNREHGPEGERGSAAPGGCPLGTGSGLA